MTLFVGINIEDLYTQVKLPTTITKYNVDTGEPYSVDADLYNFTVGDLTFEATSLLEYNWQALCLNITFGVKLSYSCHKHKSLLDFYVGIIIPNSKHYNIGEWNDKYNYREKRDLIMFKNIESVIQSTKERLKVITPNPNIVVLYKEDLQVDFHEGVPCLG